MTANIPKVLKVGGSLFDLPDLRERLHSMLAALGTGPLVLFPGGGASANVIREWDRLHRLGEESSHWLAIRSLSLNAHLLHAFFPDARLIHAREQLADGINLVEPFAWAWRDEDNPGHCPHTWSVTSDSLALRLAQTWGADELILLKSVDFPAGTSWNQAARKGLVDTYFPLRMAAAPLNVRWSNPRGSGHLVVVP